jgi:hypothetical protein
MKKREIEVSFYLAMCGDGLAFSRLIPTPDLRPHQAMMEAVVSLSANSGGQGASEYMIPLFPLY